MPAGPAAYFESERAQIKRDVADCVRCGLFWHWYGERRPARCVHSWENATTTTFGIGSLERNFGISPTLFKELAAAAAVAVFPCSVKWLYGLQICWFDQINYEAEGFALPWRGSDLLIMCSHSDPITQWTWISLKDLNSVSTWFSWSVHIHFHFKAGELIQRTLERHRTSYKLCNHEARRPHKNQSQQSVFPRIIKFLIRKKFIDSALLLRFVDLLPAAVRTCELELEEVKLWKRKSKTIAVLVQFTSCCTRLLIRVKFSSHFDCCFVSHFFSCWNCTNSSLYRYRWWWIAFSFSAHLAADFSDHHLMSERSKRSWNVAAVVGFHKKAKKKRPVSARRKT